ncbi:MAG: hypothetical protein EOP04_16135 [Proteobacteria bacterium]|nr:MAG: hypothetical protein EOP04_16135 [Pseudomonadota bacterium]
MKEIERLKQTFELLEFPEDVPIDPLLSNTPNEGQTSEFIEWLKVKPERLQANFLSYLVPFRKECIPRLLEFSSSSDEEVLLIACEALIRIDEYYNYAREKLHAGFINEIENHANDKRVMILGCLREGFMYVARREGVDVLKYYRNLAAEKNAATIVLYLDVVIPGFGRPLNPVEILLAKSKLD